MDLFLFLSILFFILSFIFLLVQGIINYKFYRFNDRKIITERTLFEQFSYEVYSNINTPLLYDIDIEDKCSNSQPVSFYLHLDTFYDCRGIFNKDLGLCRDNVNRNNTNCFSQEDSTIDYSNLDDWFVYDERKHLCNYYSKFTQRVDKLLGKSLCKKGEQLSYEYLLKISYSCPYNNIRGILDTKGHYLCLDSWPINSISYQSYSSGKSINIDMNKYINFKNAYYYDYNNKIAFVSFIISETYPLSHEWDKIVKETYEELDSKDIEKRKNLTIEDFKLLNMENDMAYLLVGEHQSDNINIVVQNFYRIKDYYKKRYNGNQILNIYARNYIGFANIEELYKFKKIFNDKDDTDNPLYKLSSSGHDPLITIILSVIFFLLSIAYFIITYKQFCNEYISHILFYVFIVLIIIFLLGELITMAVHFGKYPTIHIDMDDIMKKVLDLYNFRTFLCQIFRIISLLLKLISLIFGIIYYRKKIRKNQQIPNSNTISVNN